MSTRPERLARKLRRIACRIIGHDWYLPVSASRPDDERCLRCGQI